MSGAIPPLPQYAFMAWCLVKATPFTGTMSIVIITNFNGILHYDNG
jgi:hypothetical protein